MSLVTAGYWTVWALLFAGSLYGILHHGLIVPRREQRLADLIEIVEAPLMAWGVPVGWVEP